MREPKLQLPNQGPYVCDPRPVARTGKCQLKLATWSFINLSISRARQREFAPTFEVTSQALTILSAAALMMRKLTNSTVFDIYQMRSLGQPQLRRTLSATNEFSCFQILCSCVCLLQQTAPQHHHGVVNGSLGSGPSNLAAVISAACFKPLSFRGIT